ncbi:SusC/RagA family TonB-linked outer membrane protein [Arcticibacterium luteifluviistationis]|uniref:SusC/RagA family TonB-linked outer membrane protein n=1 Tax=Arcticibacterium luteifluviistationis TaxID=1784714 RepID=A0A2Z4G7C7_9BACT|nr:SusC/RagA family TonB-linked outer membrane protein [Arcticibacterium luteifluviistationis]AWV97057.1 SusC/RagA family TonB-linked outer membrane protein [Arcticibacterium luteifluviistationis]
MKRTIQKMLYQVALVLLIFPVGSQAFALDSNLKNTRIHLGYEKASVSKIIKDVTAKTEYNFLYEENVRENLNRVVRVGKVSNLYDLLSSVSVQASLELKELNKTIIIKKASAKTATFFKPADIRVSGKVIDENNEDLVGANITIKGTTKGTITDVNGEYSIDVPNAETILTFSYIGYNVTEEVVGNRSVIDVALQQSLNSLQDVVVTALGLERNERTLGYAVAKVDGGEVTRVAQENVLNGMAGKVPGVTINSTGGTGSSVSMVIRGASSLNSDNQPLFVVNGVPISNTLNNISQIGGDNKVDYGNAISDLNPEDIENISILKGPSAAALYGSRAANGVVLITTKSGKGVRKTTVSISSSTVFDNPYKYLDFHTSNAIGVRPYTPDNNPYPGGILQIEEGSSAGNGPELDKGYKAIQWNSPLDANGNRIPTDLVSYKDNVANFVNTGITTTNTAAISNNTELMNYRVGFTNMLNNGLVPNSDLFRNNISVSSDVNAAKNLVFSTNVNVNRSWSNNRPSGNRGTNPLEAAYKVSPHINILELEDYWVPGQEGLRQLSQAEGEYNNPYFLANEVNNGFTRDRVYGNLKADWTIAPSLKLMVRYGVDQYSEQRETKIAPSYTNEIYGAYGLINLNRYESNADFLATYTKDISDLNVSVSVGGNTRYEKGNNTKNATRNGGSGLIVPGVFTLSNTASDNLDFSSYKYEKGVNSLYAMTTFGYKRQLYLDLTARNDWSSTLPKSEASYFYPSASVSAILNEMIPMGTAINMFKLRGGWAQVGNDTSPYQLISTLNNNGEWDGVPRLSVPGNLLTPDLKPEIATSWEIGADVSAFNDRLFLQATYYQVKNRNQIFEASLAPSTGYSSKKVNAGLIQGRGWEFQIGGTAVQKGNLKWDVSANITRSRTKILELAEGMDVFKLWSDSRGGAWTYLGEDIGDIYDRKLITVEDESSPYYGYPLLDEDGSWQDISQNSARNKVGNFNPDFIAGLQSNLSYKGFSLNMSFDWRQGGDFVSQTYRYSESDLRTQRWLDLLINPGDRSGDVLRDYLVANADQFITDGINVVGGPGDSYGGYPFTYGVTINDGVFNPGVIGVYEEGELVGYQENLGGEGTKIIPYADNYPWSFFKPAMFDASYVKLREVSLSYKLPASLVNRVGINNASVSVYSRNIILWTKAKVGIDPENAFQQEDGYFKQGIERYNVTPWVLPVGFKLNLSF